MSGIAPPKVTPETAQLIIDCVLLLVNTDGNLLINNIYNCAQQIYLEQHLGIECLTFAILCSIVIQNFNYILTTKTILEEILVNEIVILQIMPLVIPYHFFVLIRINDNEFRIYSLNGEFFIPPYNVIRDEFIQNYNRFMSKNADMVYNENLLEIEQIQLWEYLTHINIVSDINKMALSYFTEGYDEENDKDELEDYKFDIWEKAVQDFLTLDINKNNKIEIYQLSVEVVGGRKSNKRKKHTKKRNKRHTKKRNKRYTKKRNKRHTKKRN
jgi:hypothetical protein